MNMPNWICRIYNQNKLKIQLKNIVDIEITLSATIYIKHNKGIFKELFKLIRKSKRRIYT
jgi:hypothetical protein